MCIINLKCLCFFFMYLIEIFEIGKIGEVWMIVLNYKIFCYILDVFKYFEGMWVKFY